MAVSSLITAGTRITAALIQSVAPLAVIKPSDETLNNSSTMQNDNDLVLPVIANASYLFSCYLDYEGQDGTMNAKWQWTVPASANLRYTAAYTNTSGTWTGGVTSNGSTVISARTSGAGTLYGASMTGSLVTAGSAGNLQLQWAQNTTTNNAPGVTVHAQSYLALWRIS